MGEGFKRSEDYSTDCIWLKVIFT